MADENDRKDGTAFSASFDPATWGKPAPGAAPAEPVAPPPETPAATQPEPPPKAPAPLSRRWMLAGAGVVVVAGAAGVAGLVLRRRAPSVAEPAQTSAAIATPGVEHVRLALSGMDAVADTLAGQGLAPAVCQAAAAAATQVLPKADGDLSLELALKRNPGGPAGLISLQISKPDGSGVRVTPQGSAFAAAPIASDAQKQVLVVHGQMDSESFYSSAVTAGLSDAVIPDFFQAFVYDFDFQREIEPGDVFEAALEETLNDQGQALGVKRLLYASMTTKAKSRALYVFTAPGADAPSWYDGAGHSNRRSLMRTPVEGARISSGFGMRFHPVLGFTRMHKGTDFATPVGTPVFASGDGVVEFVGVHGGHGNYIRIRHSPTLETAYAHLSQYGAGIVVGVAVRQGQQIALSGDTGLSSGPHVHYEVIVNGEQVDSQTFQTDEGQALAGDALKAFVKERDRIDALRATAL